jgi:glycosyltransferase involved in cell wall biosynthesis
MTNKIGIDARLVNKRRGIGNICYNLLKEISNIESDYQFIAYLDSEKIPLELKDEKKLTFLPLKPSFYPAWEQICLPMAVYKNKISLLHSIANTFPLYMPQGIKHIASINDVMFLLPNRYVPNSPSTYQRLGRIYSNFVVKSGFTHLDRIITISEYSKKDIIQYLDVDEKMITPILLGADLPNEISTEYSNSRLSELNICVPYFLVLGARDPRKNTMLIIQAFFDLLKRYQQPISLVISGLDEAGIRHFSGVTEDLGIQNHVHLLGFVSRSDLELLYSKADCFLYPSLYEGFGLPVLEAMAYGVPVISSNTTAIPEVAGDAALLVNPASKGEIVSAMFKILTDIKFRDTLTQRGLERVKLFSWKRMAQQVLETYEEVLRK